MTGPATSRRTAVAIGLFVTFLWATSAVLIRLGLSKEDVDPVGFAGVRFALAAILLLPLALPRLRAARVWHASRRWLLGVAMYGLLMFFVGQVAVYVALGELPVTTVGLFVAMAPVVTAVVVLRSEHERASIMQVAGIGVLVAGAAVYFGLALPGSEAAVGLLAAAAVAIIFGGSARLGRYLAVDSHRYGGPLGMTAMAMVVGASATLILAFAIEGVPSFSVEAWLLIIWMAAINTALAYTLWAQTQRTLRAVESSVLRDMTLVQTALLGWVVLDETLDLAQVLGLALALGGVALVQLAPMLRGPGRQNIASEVAGPTEPR